MTPDFALLGSGEKRLTHLLLKMTAYALLPPGRRCVSGFFQHAAFLAYLSTHFYLNPHPGEGTWEPTSKMTPDFLAPLGESGTETPFFLK
jgi:hypothetical protein